MPIIAESQFPWSKNSISMPFDTEVRGGRRFNVRKFPATLATLLSSIGVSHKLIPGRSFKFRPRAQTEDRDSN